MPLSGVIEADETYHGPKTHRKQKKDENGEVKPRKRGRGTENKVPVFGVVERGGEVRTMPVEDVKAKTLQAEIEKHVDLDSILMTDQFQPYVSIGKNFKRHESVNHSEEEYVRYYKNDDDRPDAHTNTIEGAFSLLKRGIIGIYHHVSPEHLHRYCAEFDYRYNTRKLKDAERFGVTLRRIEDRLKYKELIANGVWANRRKQEQEAQEREGGRQEGEEGTTSEV
jgi:transposase-like protein